MVQIEAQPEGKITPSLRAETLRWAIFESPNFLILQMSGCSGNHAVYGC